MFYYAAVVWWTRSTLTTVGKQLEYLQRLACLYVTGAMRTTPTAALEIIIGIVPLAVFIKQEAMSACYRLKLSSQWVQTNCGHTQISGQLSQFIPLSRLRCDKILAQYSFDRNYEVHIHSRQEWIHNNILLNDEVVCYTDGSRTAHLSGAGIYNSTDNTERILPLGQLCSVFQAEVYAILQWALLDDLRHRNDTSIAICSDSQAALKALTAAKITSALVAETVAALE